MQIDPTTTAATEPIGRPALQLVPACGTDRPPGARRSYALELEDSPDALERVLAHLRRRRCRVTDVAFAAPYADGAPATAVVGTEMPREDAHRVESWLAEIVCVHAVEAITR
jgi:acetolactate synthase regulatory subunit